MLNYKRQQKSKVQLLHIQNPSLSKPSSIDTHPSCIPNAGAYLYIHKPCPIFQHSQLFIMHRYAVKIQVASNFTYSKFISRPYYYTPSTCRIIRYFRTGDFIFIYSSASVLQFLQHYAIQSQIYLPVHIG